MIPNKRIMDPDLCALLDQFQDLVSSEINCISLGTIQTFYAADQTADIQLNYKRISLTDNKITGYPLLVKCPVVVLGGSGTSSYLSFPIAKNDQCLVLFCDREIDTWFKTGGINAPQSLRIHDLNDGIALVGLRSSINSIANYGTDGIKIFNNNGFIQIKNDGSININTNGNISVYGSILNYYGTTVNTYGSTLHYYGTNVDLIGNPNVNITGTLTVSGTAQIFGGWVAKTDSIVYHAPTDGYAMGYNSSSGFGVSILGYTDGSAAPTTLRKSINIYNADNPGEIADITMPVRKGDYWKIVGSPACTVWWLGIGQ